MSSYAQWIREKVSWNAVGDDATEPSNVPASLTTTTASVVPKTVEESPRQDDDCLHELDELVEPRELPETGDELNDDLPVGSDWETLESPASPVLEKSPILKSPSPVCAHTPPVPRTSTPEKTRKRRRMSNSSGDSFGSSNKSSTQKKTCSDKERRSSGKDDDCVSLSSLSEATWPDSDDEYIKSINKPRRPLRSIQVREVTERRDAQPSRRSSSQRYSPARRSQDFRSRDNGRWMQYRPAARSSDRLASEEEDGGDYIDSHLHLDLMDADGITVGEWKPKLDQRFRLAGCIANYCYPTVFMPTSSYAGSQNDDRRKSESMSKLAWVNLDVLTRKQTLMPSDLVLGACFGVHPKNAAEYNDEVHERLRSIFGAGEASGMKILAVGECGLDESSDIVPSSSVQEEAFRRQVELAKEFNLPLVLHLRGRDCHDDSLDRWTIEFLKPLLDSSHRIHRHCFCHSKATADAWLDAFPNTMFGLTPKIAGKRCEQHLVTFAREYPLDHIILETDSPFFDRNGRGHPGNALVVAKQLARLRGIRVNDVLKKTTANTRMLYGLPGND